MRDIPMRVLDLLAGGCVLFTTLKRKKYVVISMSNSYLHSTKTLASYVE